MALVGGGGGFRWVFFFFGGLQFGGFFGYGCGPAMVSMVVVVIVMGGCGCLF